MATSNKSKAVHIGIIAEDDSDVLVTRAILQKYAGDRQFSVKKFVGSGCGRLKRNCKHWTDNLLERGCQFVIVLHDLDRNNENELRKTLQKKLPRDIYPQAAIIIPVEELEAWLLSDEKALKDVFSLKQLPKRYKNCDDVPSPKEEIGRLIYNMARKRYVNTVHNQRIAERVTLDCLRRCRSYLPLDTFLSETVFP